MRRIFCFLLCRGNKSIAGLCNCCPGKEEGEKNKQDGIIYFFRSPNIIEEHIIIQTPSPRLRWAFTLSYLFVIYATLGIARPITEQLRTIGFLAPTVIFLFIIFTLPALGWRYAATDRGRMVLRGVLVTFLLTIAVFMDGLPEERIHFLTYGLLGWLICWSLEATKNNLLRAKNSWLLACMLVWLAGGIDELIQWWLPVRVFEVRDILLNCVAGTLGIVLFATGNRR